MSWYWFVAYSFSYVRMETYGMVLWKPCFQSIPILTFNALIHHSVKGLNMIQTQLVRTDPFNPFPASQYQAFNNINIHLHK